MKPRNRTVAFLVIATLLAALAATVAPAGARQSDDRRSEHERIIDFWTNERVQKATPRDFVFDAGSGRFIPAAPGGNGKGRPDGGGSQDGGGSTTVTDASWESGGEIANATGKVLFALGANLYVCSATVIDDPGGNDRSLVLTAAHCAYDHAAGFATNWIFVPNFDADPADSISGASYCATTQFGCWTASSLVVHDGFVSAGGFNGVAVQYDFAVAVLGNGGLPGATSDGLVEGLGSESVSFAPADKGTPVFAFGYPQAASPGGQDLRYCAGDTNVDNRLFKLTYKLACGMTGGASGGGWLSGFDPATGVGSVMSVNSYRYSGGSDMYGPKLNADTQDVYDRALTAGTNAIVGQ